jgi:hypothetical protein
VYGAAGAGKIAALPGSPLNFLHPLPNPIRRRGSSLRLSVDAYALCSCLADIGRSHRVLVLRFSESSSLEYFMSDSKPGNDPSDSAERIGENKLRGGALRGSERRQAVDHAEYDRKRNPDAVVRVDNEEDTLYDDGLELEDDTPPLTNNDGTVDDSH